MFFKRKILTVRQSLQSIAIELHQANDVRKRALHEAMKQTKLLESLSEGRVGAEAVQGFNDTMRPLIDRIMGGASPSSARVGGDTGASPPIEQEASGIRTVADPKA